MSDGVIDRDQFRRYGCNGFTEGEKFRWKDSWHESEKIQFLQSNTNWSCDKCRRKLSKGNLISTGIRQVNVDAPGLISGIDRVHYKCYWEGNCWGESIPITETEGYQQLSKDDKETWLKWSTLLPKPQLDYCECIQKFKKHVINFDWKGAPDDSSLTVKLFSNVQGAYKKHGHLTYEVEQIGGKCEWKQQGCKNGKFSKWKKQIFSAVVTIYPTCRDKLLEKSKCSVKERANDIFDIVGNFMVIAENALYFTLKTFGLPENVCGGWIYECEGYRIDSYHPDVLGTDSVSKYLDNNCGISTFEFKKKSVITYSGYSNYVKKRKNKVNNSNSNSKVDEKKQSLRRSARIKQKKEESDVDSSDDVPMEKSNKTQGKKRKLTDSDDESDSDKPKPKRRRRAPRRKRN